MSAFLGLSILVAGSVGGALCAIAFQYTRPWQIIIGALLGVVLAEVVLRVWSDHAAAQALRNPGENVVIARASTFGWRARLISHAILAGFAIMAGGLVVLIRRIFVRPD